MAVRMHVNGCNYREMDVCTTDYCHTTEWCPDYIRFLSESCNIFQEECPNLTMLSSSPSLDGTPSKLIPINNNTCCSDFQEMNLPSFKPTFLFLVRIPLDVIHECIRLRLEQQPETEPSIHSVKQVRGMSSLLYMYYYTTSGTLSWVMYSKLMKGIPFIWQLIQRCVYLLCIIIYSFCWTYLLIIPNKLNT